ncbi:MAG TPA: VWA domain-containing protein [Bryobacteraceae bacterium]|jgi:VWFA-related protein
MFWWKASKVGLLGVLPLAGSFAASLNSLNVYQDPAVFRAGTRFVEVQVVVRNQPVRPPGLSASLKYVFDSGPPFGPPGELVKGLTKDDFTLLDEGKAQPIAVFREGPSDDKPFNLPPGAISNRTDNSGKPLQGATAVLIDFLNTGFDFTGYQRMGMTNFMRSLAEDNSRIGLYTLGENLHILQNFSDDPQKLLATAAKLDQPKGALPADLKSSLRDFGDLMDLGKETVHSRITLNAMRVIVQHLSGMPGRKNLVWFMDDPRNVPPQVIAMAQQANIVLYPVLVRLVRTGPGGPSMNATRAFAALTGGRAFLDAKDLSFAVHTAQEDTATSYVLGYYPDEHMLDGKYHNITIKIHDKAPEKQTLEVNYRPGYLATKVASRAPSPTPMELLEGPVNLAGIGLAAQAIREADHPELYDLHLTVDLHDIHLERKEDRFVGAFDLTIPNPPSQGTVRSGVVTINLTDAQLAKALESGYPLGLTGVQSETGEVRVVVRDRATGAAGSLRVPLAGP